MHSSHTIVACLIGYGLALTAAFMATHYQKFRLWGLAGRGRGGGAGAFCLWDATGKHYFGPAGQVKFSEMPHWIAPGLCQNQYGLPIFANLLLVAIALAFVAALLALSPARAAVGDAGSLCRHAALLRPGPLV